MRSAGLQNRARLYENSDMRMPVRNLGFSESKTNGDPKFGSPAP
jgi:hypothetical protein